MHRHAPQAFPLRAQPIGIGRIGDVESVKEIARIDRRRTAQFIQVLAGGKGFEHCHIDLHQRGIECHPVVVEGARRNLQGVEASPQLSKRLPQAGARLLVAAVAPQEIREFVARARPAGGQREIGEERARLLGRDLDGSSGCCGDMEAVEQRDLKRSHGRHPTRHFRTRAATAPDVGPLTNFSRGLRAAAED